MKKNNIILRVLFIMLLSIVMINTNAQTGLNFQGVARNSNNVILASQPISLRLSILQGSTSGAAEYTEIRRLNTNAQGLFTAVIGDTGALRTLGNFTTINWKNTPKFLKIEMDAAAGTNFITMGTTQFQYVAYAQFAKSVDAENIVGIVPVTLGGTGAATASAARTSLGLVIGTDVLAPTGNAATATKLATAKNINGVAFDGSGDITITSITDAGNITGTTLNASVTNSSLTGVGTITSGVWNGTEVAIANGGTGQTSIDGIKSTLGLSGFEVAIGSTAGLVTQGANAVAIGTQAGSASQGSDAIAIGRNASRYLQGVSAVAIGANSDAGFENSVAIGKQASTSAINTIQLGNTSITNVKTSGTLTAGAITYPSIHGTSGQVLTSTGSGTLTWTGTHYIGETYGGGIIFYVYDNGKHGLIAATSDQGTGIRWYGGSNTITRARAGGVGAGLKNTALIIANQGAVDGNAFAATVCNEYSVTVDGVTYGDWYLPSKNELNLLYLQKSVVGGFVIDGLYWSSTEYNSDYAWYQLFGSGFQNNFFKNDAYYVRAIRAF